LECLKGRYHAEDVGVDGRIILKATLQEIGWEFVDWNIWFRVWTGGGLFSTR
jgi:hypothetical protein